MSFLSIDCSTSANSLFIKAKNKTFSKILQSDKTSNDLLMKEILVFFAENDLNFNHISKIFVNQGPGSFSGLRTSLSIAKGISLSKNLDLLGYNTFIWSCAKFFKKNDTIFSLIKIRDKYFIQGFKKNLKNPSKPEEISEKEILKKYEKKFKVIPGNIANQFDTKILNLDNLNIVDLDHNELEFLHLKGLLDDKLIKPLYLH